MFQGYYYNFKKREYHPQQNSGILLLLETMITGTKHTLFCRFFYKPRLVINL